MDISEQIKSDGSLRKQESENGIPGASHVVDGEATSGLRLCLNSVTRPELERALRIIRSVLADEIVPGQMAIV
ncbi:MAG: hypothetical protein ACR2OU_08460 [Thermomicrobiales bacterium]